MSEDNWEMEHSKRVAGFPADVRDAHSRSSHHRDEVLASSACGCFYCLETFKPAEISDWCDDGGTAICPRCGIDSVIGSASSFPITKDFLTKMKSYWF